MLPVLTYSLARIALFVAAAAALWLVGAGPVLALAGGLLVSLLLSYVLLGRLREPATAAIAARVQARTSRRVARGEEDELLEDRLVDERLAEERAPEDRPGA